MKREKREEQEKKGETVYKKDRTYKRILYGIKKNKV